MCIIRGLHPKTALPHSIFFLYFLYNFFSTTKPTHRFLCFSLFLSALFSYCFLMARLATLSLIFVVVFASFASSSQARKLLLIEDEEKRVPSPVDSLFLGALPKGKVPSSTPSKKGHAVVVDEKLIARHLIAMDRILQSVPSPGMGH